MGTREKPAATDGLEFTEEGEDARYAFARVSHMVLQDRTLSAHAKLLYCVARTFLKKGSAEVYPSYKTLAALCGFSRSTAIRAAQELAERGLWRITLRRDEKLRCSTNVITFADPLKLYGLTVPARPKSSRPSSRETLPPSVSEQLPSVTLQPPSCTATPEQELREQELRNKEVADAGTGTPPRRETRLLTAAAAAPPGEGAPAPPVPTLTPYQQARALACSEAVEGRFVRFMGAMPSPDTPLMRELVAVLESRLQAGLPVTDAHWDAAFADAAEFWRRKRGPRTAAYVRCGLEKAFAAEVEAEDAAREAAAQEAAADAEERRRQERATQEREREAERKQRRAEALERDAERQRMAPKWALLPRDSEEWRSLTVLQREAVKHYLRTHPEAWERLDAARRTAANAGAGAVA